MTLENYEFKKSSDKTNIVYNCNSNIKPAILITGSTALRSLKASTLIT